MIFYKINVLNNEQHPPYNKVRSVSPIFRLFVSIYLCFHSTVTRKDGDSLMLMLRGRVINKIFSINLCNGKGFVGIVKWEFDEDTFLAVGVCTMVRFVILRLPGKAFDRLLSSVGDRTMKKIQSWSDTNLLFRDLREHYWFWDYSQDMNSTLYYQYGRGHRRNGDKFTGLGFGFAKITKHLAPVPNGLNQPVYKDSDFGLGTNDRGVLFRSSPYRGCPINQYFFLVEYYSPRYGGIGCVIGIVDPIGRWVRIKFKSLRAIQSFDISFLLVFKVSTMLVPGFQTVDSKTANKIIAVPVTRVGGFKCIDGVYCCNVLVPKEAYCYINYEVRVTCISQNESRDGEGNRDVLPDTSKTCFEKIYMPIDLDKLIVIDDTKFNIFRRKNAFFNIINKISK